MSYSCSDFLGFQEALKKMREIDDKIVYALNSIPTESFRHQISSEATCKELYGNLTKGHGEREEAIKQCILVSANKLKTLKEKRENDIKADQEFKAEQRKLRVLQSELNVEDIVKERSYKAFNERCRKFLVASSK
ncbi:CCDC58 family protein [Megaselia abdita]